MFIQPYSRQWSLLGLGLILLLLISTLHPVQAAPEFPKLSGRVVDQAGLLSATTQQTISQQLAQHEAQTSNQVVLLTLSSLNGYDISDYGVQLGRFWKLGDKDKNNGVILIIAPNERKLRIEVGYGLEGALPDAIASDIINRRMVPFLKQNDYNAAATTGINAILQAIAGEYQAAPKTKQQDFPAMFILGGFFLLFGLMAFLMPTLPRGGGGNGPGGINSTGLDHYGGGFGHSGRGSSGGFGGGGFSGGGGSFGGGGASGGW